MFVILFSLLLTGCCATATGRVAAYDYSASIDCLPEPLPPQYNGGVVQNPGFDSGTRHWRPFGKAKLTSRKTRTGNNFLVAFHRTKPFDSFSFRTHIQNDLVYVFSAWVQLNRGTDVVSVSYTSNDKRYIMIGSVVAKSGCWSMIKGGFTANQDTKADFYFSSNNTDAELWVDNVSLKPFKKSEWQAHQNRMIEHVRKRKVRIHVVTRDGKKKKKLPGAKITLDQTRPKFTIGSGSPQSILTSKAYQDYFTARFTAVTPHNELKWYFTESARDHENYTVPDTMLAFFKKHDIAVRGHTVLWANPNMNQRWVRQMQPRDIQKAAIRRVRSVVSRYSGHVNGWDVMNENLHFNFYESKLGPNASAMFYKMVHAIDPNTRLFLNEYNTIEVPADTLSIPSKYVAKFREMRAFPGNENLPVSFGLQGHFHQRPMVSYIRAVFDILGTTGMKIWITELDTGKGTKQAEQLEEVMREAYAHPAVEGIIVWGGWKESGCSQACLKETDPNHLGKGGCSMMCLVDNEFKNLPPGDVVDKLIKEWKTTDVKGVTDENGVFEMDVFLGKYTLTSTHPSDKRRFKTETFDVPRGKGPMELRVYL